MKNTHTPTVYGYARVSTLKQNIDRQITNIKERDPQAVIITEAYTGTKMTRPAWTKLYKKLAAGDTVIFDEVSRMSRNAAEGFEVYEELYQRGVNLVFIKEPYINTDVYRNNAQKRVDATISTGKAATDKFTAAVLEAVNDLIMDLAKEQITAAFEQAQAEVDHLHQRTSEGVRRAQAEGKQIGRATGATVTTKKSIEAKEQIKKYCKDFDGSLTDKDTMQLIGIARNTYYKYKREIVEELAED